MDYLSTQFKYLFLRNAPDTHIIDEIDEIKELSAFETKYRNFSFIQMVTPTTTDDEAESSTNEATDIDTDDDTQWKKEEQEAKEKLEKKQMLCNIL